MRSSWQLNYFSGPTKHFFVYKLVLFSQSEGWANHFLYCCRCQATKASPLSLICCISAISLSSAPIPVLQAVLAKHPGRLMQLAEIPNSGIHNTDQASDNKASMSDQEPTKFMPNRPEEILYTWLDLLRTYFTPVSEVRW